MSPIDIRFERARAMRWGRTLASVAAARSALMEAEQGADLDPATDIRALTSQVIEAERRLWAAWTKAHKAKAVTP